MLSMARLLDLRIKPLLTYPKKTSGDRHSQTLSFYYRKVERVASFTTKQGRSLVALEVKQANVADPNTSCTAKADARSLGNNSPAAVSSGHSLNFLSIISSWNVWLTGTALLLSVPIYRRITRVEVELENAEKRAEKAKETIDKVAEEAEEIEHEVANMTNEETISDLAFKMEYIVDKIEHNSQKAQEVLKKVDHLKLKVEELLDAKIEEEERCNAEEDNNN